MATGVSKSNWRSPNGSRTVSSTANGAADIVMDYVGKKPAEAILDAPPAQLTRLWPQNKPKSSVNRLYFGDNLPILAALANDPSVCGHVRLVYIDPPYATRSVFQSRKQADAYSDLLEGAHYLEFLRERLIFLRELLANDGSIYMHLDENMAFYAKAIMDEVFGQRNFRNWITRKKCNPKNYTHKTYGNISDYILFYSKSDGYVWHRPVDEWTENRATKEYQYVEAGTGRRYKKVPIHAPGTRNGETGKLWHGMLPPPGKHWQYLPNTLDEMDARGEIFWSANGNPRRKIYLDASGGIPVQDIWLEFRDAHNQNVRITGYPTEKNPLLLNRIIQASSNEGDLVLDCFSGSGTTLEVAHRANRRWIGIDNSIEAIKTTLQRFAQGLEPMGDFVKKMQTLDQLEAENPEQPMLDFPQNPSVRPESHPAHSPIREFDFLAIDPHDPGLDKIREEFGRHD